MAHHLRRRRLYMVFVSYVCIRNGSDDYLLVSAQAGPCTGTLVAPSTEYKAIVYCLVLSQYSVSGEEFKQVYRGKFMCAASFDRFFIYRHFWFETYHLFYYVTVS